MKFSVIFFLSLYISLLYASLSSCVFAAQTDKAERWFEIEVILFKQLGDKKTLKEQFPDHISSKTLPKPKKYFDLLTTYIQPSLTSTKQFMPLCSTEDKQHTFLELSPKINTSFPDAIKVIERADRFNMPIFTTQNKAMIQQKELVLHLQEELASPLFSTQNLCVIRHQDIEKLFTDEQLANFQFDTIGVKAMPAKLDALGEHMSGNAYLIANDSLLLSDINQSLQQSKEFKPLLHFGWHQIGITRDKAIPLKLFAGKNLDYQYQQDLNDYQSTLDKTKLVEQLVVSNDEEKQKISGETRLIEQNKNTEIKQQQLTELFNNISTVDSTNIDDLISALEQQKVEELLVINDKNKVQSERLNINSPPVKPLQSWFLDGFFKIHLDHYLYITADFNVVGESLDKTTNDSTEKTNVKLINFSQNKRAITGEIHYFDHPYIGMIVQIRRFDPSKPKEEAVSQVIN
jgi:hypothetical protein